MKTTHQYSTYRPDVDGLRAVAVLAVLIYHAGFSVIPGGYVGVDIFFVISGFVITSAVQPDLASGRFNLRDFYERRIRRIFPPLFVMVVVSLVLGWMVLMPDDLKRLGQSSVANAAFLSNFYFLKDSGYFGATAAAKPLLHTWSLAVEEQFYLLLPLYMLLFKRWSADVMRWLTLSLFALSLLLAAVATYFEPTLSFFLLPTRAWELLAGVMLAQGMVPSPRSAKDEWARALLGIFLIAYALLAYSEKTVFPGLAALPPVLGGMLIISAGMRREGRANAWLASRTMVFLGQISYPLYLWHFPLLGFAGYLSLRGLGVAETLAVYAIIVICALVSWRFVEQPVRTRRVFSGQRALFGFGLVCIVVTLLAGLALHFGRGMESRFSGDQLKLVRGMTDRLADKGCMVLSPVQVASGNVCRLGSKVAGLPDTFLWGDSHAEAWAPGFAEQAERTGKAVLFAGQHGCAIGQHFLDTSWAGKECAAFDKTMLDYLLAQTSIKQVVLVSRWTALRTAKQAEEVNGRLVPTAEQALTRVVTQLVNAGKQVRLVGPVPDAKTLVPRALYLKSLGFAKEFEVRQRLDEFESVQKNTLVTLRNLANQQGVSLTLPHLELCKEGLCAVEQDGYPLYFDDNHLSTHGARLVMTSPRM
ncbi:acyltransferase family protein [Limnohabitans sp. 2KL-3]|uniref:acyltransferase family protein n=1 Tax=Limnohabitans sp. 2KL-3 TaxID=1100700 RepID=UPI000A943AA0|nr:acyltransferase family protein [Limnohabitans sp. 2KL-3]